MKLTNIQLYNYGRKKADDSNGTFWKPPTFIQNYHEARLEWIRLKLPDFERNEAVRRDLEPFVVEPHNFGAVNRISLGALLHSYAGLTMIHGEWGFMCDGQITKRTLPIPPKPIEKAIPALLDFAEQPADTDPWYIEEKEGELMYIRVMSQNVPDNLTIHYVRHPKPLDLVNEPDGYTEEGQTQQLEILAIALKKMKVTSENYNSAQAIGQEIAQKGT